MRSSYYLEDAASEFDVQGLELDWTAVVWDGDLIHQPGAWRYRTFKGTRWQEIRDLGAQRYRLNAYRVLLTRARQGMVVVVPEGNDTDPTRQVFRIGAYGQRRWENPKVLERELAAGG